MKYFKIKMLEDNNYTMEALKLEIDKAYKQSTSVNFGISYGCTNNIACICVANEAGDIKDVTQNPTIDNQIMSGVLPVVKSTRPPAFDNFKYKEYPLFDREITTSNQLFYVLQYGYQPKIVDKFSPAQKMLDEAKKALKECIDPSMDDFDKLYAIYCWMVMNVSYDHQALKDNAAEEEKENHYYSNTCEAWHMEGVFNRHLAVCDGISKAMVLMCRLEGIPCIRVTGPGHAWNKVYIDVDGDGKGTAQWYSLDATWGDLGDGANSTNLDISSFLYKDVDKNNDDGPMPCENHLDIVADTNIDVYENINFEINGQTYDLFMPNKEELDIFITYCHNFINANSSLTTFSIGIYVDMTLMTTPKSILDAVHAGLVYVENKKKANDIDLDCKNCIPITDNKIILIFTKL